MKLCAAALGGAKRAANTSIQYAITREQFKTSIANFGAIKNKIAEMAIHMWVCESALYRTAKWIDDKEHELLQAANLLTKPCWVLLKNMLSNVPC